MSAARIIDNAIGRIKLQAFHVVRKDERRAIQPPAGVLGLSNLHERSALHVPVRSHAACQGDLSHSENQSQVLQKHARNWAHARGLQWHEVTEF